MKTSRGNGMKRLSIFIDETGEFGFGKGSSRLYGVSFVFHDQSYSIKKEINDLNQRLLNIGYINMIHMADLIMKRGDYSNMNITKRKNIFNAIYYFLRKIPVKYQTIIIDKKYTDNSKVLRRKIRNEIIKMLEKNKEFFKKYDSIILYYDNGQETLGNILEDIFSKFKNFKHVIDFNHKVKRLFQVADMLTYLDKYNYKYKNKIPIANGEKYFFTGEEIRKAMNKLDKKKL